MPSWFNSWFGSQAAGLLDATSATLEITDGETTISLVDSQNGWSVLFDGWSLSSPVHKGGGSYSDSYGHGKLLYHAALDNVAETWRLRLRFWDADSLLLHWQTLEKLLLINAPRYWADYDYDRMVYVKRQIPGESYPAYYYLSLGQVTWPGGGFNRFNIDQGMLMPVLVSFNRQPFIYGAPPGDSQGAINVSSEQDWEYNLDWAEEDTTPAGDVFCSIEASDGNIWAGGASEILEYTGGAWAAVATAPVTLAADVTSVVELNDGTLLFGESGRVVKRTAAGVWSVESTTPSGQLWGAVLAPSGVVYFADNGQIIKRAVDGTYSVDDTLPSGQMYSFLVQSATGRVYAGGTSEILRQVVDLTSTTTTYTLAAATDNAEQYGTTAYTNPTVGSPADLDFGNRNYVALRYEIDVPADAEINEAYIEFTPRRTRSGTMEATKIYCEDADDAAAFAAGVNNISDRTLTTAYVTWQPTTAMYRDANYRTPDLSGPVQEAVDRAGWAADQHLVVVVKADTLASAVVSRANRIQAYGYDLNPAYAPRLVITYTPAPAADAGWEVASTAPSGAVRSMLQPSSGDGLMLAGETGQVLGSNDGELWTAIDSTPTGAVLSLYEDGDGYVWAGEDSTIYRSVDGGRDFVSHATLPTGAVHTFIQETSTGDLRAGDNGRILILDASDTVTLGMDETDDFGVPFCNHHKTSNITHVKIDDGGAFTDIFPMTSLPVTLLPANPAANDALYIGTDASVADSGPFDNVWFCIGVPASSTTSYTITWEYWNGGWVGLTTHDETSQLSETGNRCLAWKKPSDWATTAIDGVTGYWIRGRVSALTGTLTPPTQQTQSLYSVAWPFVEISKHETHGNVDSLVKLALQQRSAADGPGGSEPLLYVNRVWGGLKEYDGHERFRAFLNWADEQNPLGVSLDVTVDPDSATSVVADPTLSGSVGRVTFIDAGTVEGGNGLDNWEDRCTLKMTQETAKHYKGRYKVLLRVKQSGGSAGEVALKVKVTSGSGGVTVLTDAQVTASTTDHELIIFQDPVSIPATSQFTGDEVADQTSITVRASFAANDADIYLYDIFLLPVDEAWFDCEDIANTAESTLEVDRELVIDGVSVPKLPTRVLLKKKGTSSHITSWNWGGNGRARVMARTRQRLWFCSARTNAAAGTVWLSEPEVVLSAKVEHLDRWTAGRGAD